MKYFLVFNDNLDAELITYGSSSLLNKIKNFELNETNAKSKIEKLF